MPEPSFNPTTPTDHLTPIAKRSEKEDAFLLYTIFCGDAIKTAHSLNVDVGTIVALARDEGWDAKVGQLAELRKSDKPGDLERAINRACNFAQAHRVRQELERTIDMIRSWSDAELREMLITTSVDSKGRIATHFSTRPLADLTASLEKAHMLTYLALGDTAQDRARRKEETDDSIIAASAMHAQIAKAMAEIAIEHSPKEILLKEQIAQASRITGDPSEAPTEIIVPPLP